MCESHYEAALAALGDSALDRGSSRKLVSHVDNAWRMSGRGDTDAAVHQLDVALRQLAGEPTTRVSPATRDELKQAISALRDCLTGQSTPHDQLRQLEETGVIPVLDRSTDVQGPDQNMDGIRDDVANHIATLPISDAQGRGVRQFAKAIQRALMVNPEDPAAVRSVSVDMSRAVQCLSVGFPDVNQRAAVATEIESISVNTRERTDQYIKFNNALSGSVAKLLSGDTCDEE